MSSKKIQSTRNYRLFTRHSNENRPVDERKHKKLLESMKLYGFLECFPIVCVRDKNGNLVVKDGQHRLGFAETLQLPVHWVEEKVDFDVAIVNSAAKVWVPKDYALKHAANGLKPYQEGLDFCEQHGLSIGIGFSLLAGTTSFTNIENRFFEGTFKVKDRTWADSVVGVYCPLTLMSADVKNTRLLEACMAACRLPEFDHGRLLDNAKRCRDKLVSFSTRDAYLDMMEEIYNFGRHKLVGLKAAAMMVMRDRNVGGKLRKAAHKNGKPVKGVLVHA